MDARKSRTRGSGRPDDRATKGRARNLGRSGELEIVVTRIPADSTRLKAMQEALAKLALAHLNGHARPPAATDARDTPGQSQTGAA
jgi:hypothetical protein